MGVVLVGLDLLRPRQEEKGYLALVALAGLTGAFAAALTLRGCNTRLFSVFSCDDFALVVKLIALGTFALLVIISSDDIRPRRNPHHGAFYALLLLAAAAIGLVGAAADLIALALALALFDGVVYLLAGSLRSGPHAGEAAVKHLVYNVVLLALLLHGMAWLYGLTGSTNLDTIAAALADAETAPRTALLPPLTLLIAGLAAKAAVAPFHLWAPDIQEGAPLPVKTLLSVGPLIIGTAGLARVLMTALPLGLHPLDADWRALMIALAVITMTLGNLMTLWQRDARRFLAAMGVAQAGYILIGLAAASTPQGLTAALFALIAYIPAILGAVAAFTVLAEHTGSHELTAWAGMHHKAPETSWLLIPCLLSLAGLPPTVGFFGRLWLFSAGFQAGLTWLVIIGAVHSVIALAGIWRVVHTLFVIPPQEEERLSPPPLLTFAQGIAAAAVLTLALLASPFLALCMAAAQALIKGG